MKIRNLVMEDFLNYKKPSMFIISSYCNFKCCHEQNIPETICQNEPLIADTKIVEISEKYLFNNYINNPITKSIVIGGLEPFIQFEEVYSLIKYFRENNCDDDFVIYTGYNKEEIQEELNKLKQFKNIIIKFGRFIPNQAKHYDEILGIELISPNQYAEKIS